MLSQCGGPRNVPRGPGQGVCRGAWVEAARGGWRWSFGLVRPHLPETAGVPGLRDSIGAGDPRDAFSTRHPPRDSAPATSALLVPPPPTPISSSAFPGHTSLCLSVFPAFPVARGSRHVPYTLRTADLGFVNRPESPPLRPLTSLPLCSQPSPVSPPLPFKFLRLSRHFH